ncbi:hypothetical protein Tco_0559214 [Tanacetum coccineum]
MIACVEKTEHNADFHQIIDYLAGCSINYSLLVDPDLIGPWLQQFWATASLRVINEVPHIRAMVAGKRILMSEATIRADLLFDDADGVDCFPKQVIWDSLRDIGYEGNLAQLTFSKPLFSPQWKYLVHVLLHCLSPKSTSWEQFGTNIASALVGLATNQKFNFSLMIMNGMLGHISNGTPFIMYPRFIQLFLNKQLEGVTRPTNFLPSVTLPSKRRNSISRQRKSHSNNLILGLQVLQGMLKLKHKATAIHNVLTAETTREFRSQEANHFLKPNRFSAQGQLKKLSKVGRASAEFLQPNSYTQEEEEPEEQFQYVELLADTLLDRTRGLSIPGPMQSQPQQPTQATDPKEKAEWDAEEERKRLEALKKPKTILKKPTSLVQERNQMMSFLKGQGYKNLQKLKYPQMKELYDKVQESIKDSFKDFIPMGSEKEKQMLQERDAKRLLMIEKSLTITKEQSIEEA